MTSLENRILALLILGAAAIVGWTLRGSLVHTVQTWLIVGAFAFAGAGLIIGAIVAWNRLAGWFKRPKD